jgi:chromosome segregation ATPase
MRTQSGTWIAVFGVVTLMALRGAAQEAPGDQVGTLSALLTEVRGLRAAIEQMASAGPRVQLAMGRLQLQEQRVNTMIRRLDDVRAQMSAVEKENVGLQEHARNIQGVLDRNSLPEERANLEADAARSKRELARLAGEIQRLQAEDADISTQIATEQNRWADINRTLEELERSLTRR